MASLNRAGDVRLYGSAGLPTRRESYGNRKAIVFRGRVTPSTWRRAAGSVAQDQQRCVRCGTPIRSWKSFANKAKQATGEPGAWKLARPVRMGLLEKALQRHLVRSLLCFRALS